MALISGTIPGGPTLSSGVYVIYSDDESFSYMNPEGHPWAGMITFSADAVAGATEAQVRLLIRTYDPLTEIGMMLLGHRLEHRLWVDTLTTLASHFGVERPHVERTRVKVDEKRLWRNVGNWRRSSVIFAVRHPLGGRRRGRAAPVTQGR